MWSEEFISSAFNWSVKHISDEPWRGTPPTLPLLILSITYFFVYKRIISWLSSFQNNPQNRSIVYYPKFGMLFILTCLCTIQPCMKRMTGDLIDVTIKTHIQMTSRSIFLIWRSTVVAKKETVQFTREIREFDIYLLTLKKQTVWN